MVKTDELRKKAVTQENRLLVELCARLDAITAISGGTPVGAALETTLLKLVESAIGEYDSRDIAYVAAGNGAGEVETIVYKLGVSIIATETFVYDASNRVITITKS